MTATARKHIAKAERFSTFYGIAVANPGAFGDAETRNKAKIALARKKTDLAREMAALQDALFAGSARRSDASHNNPFDARIGRKKTATLFVSVQAGQDRVNAVENALTNAGN